VTSKGFAIFLTGLSGSGKSTIANCLLDRLRDCGRPVILDGDIVRQFLSPDLGYSRKDRDDNIRRIGFVASLIVRCGGIAIIAAIAPYDNVRKEVRQMIEEHGEFFLVHIATPLDICEFRDPKGLYMKARSGELVQFTGVSDPYEEPTDAEIIVQTVATSPGVDARSILSFIDGYFSISANEDQEVA
jgi:sulfate adenylyltransferase